VDSPSPQRCQQCGVPVVAVQRRYCGACNVRRENAQHKQYEQSQRQRVAALNAQRAALLRGVSDQRGSHQDADQ
jgi:hypothetical protein